MQTCLIARQHLITVRWLDPQTDGSLSSFRPLCSILWRPGHTAQILGGLEGGILTEPNLVAKHRQPG